MILISITGYGLASLLFFFALVGVWVFCTRPRHEHNDVLMVAFLLALAFVIATVTRAVLFYLGGAA